MNLFSAGMVIAGSSALSVEYAPAFQPLRPLKADVVALASHSQEAVSAIFDCTRIPGRAHYKIERLAFDVTTPPSSSRSHLLKFRRTMVDSGSGTAPTSNGEAERRTALWEMYDRMKSKMFQDVGNNDNVRTA